mgnify:CR=1 FL=1
MADPGLPLPDPWQRLPRRSLALALSLLPLVALANVAVLAWSLGWAGLADALAAPGLMLLAGALAFVPLFANALRLALWGRFLGLGLGFRGALKVLTGTMIANSLSPSAAGGVPIKVLFLIGEGLAPRRAATLISLQTAEDAALLGTLALVCAGVSGFQLADFLGDQPGLLARAEDTAMLVLAGALGGVAGLAGLGGALAAGLFGARLRARAAKLWGRVHAFVVQLGGDWLAVVRSGKGVALLSLALGLVQWLARFSLAGLVLAAFGEPWHPALYWLLQYLVQAISSLVPTPGGAGGAEAAFLLLFASFVSPDVLAPAMSTWRLIFFYLPLAGAAVIFVVLERAAHRYALGLNR